MAAREYRRAAERRHRVRFDAKREQAARVESMQSPSSVTGFYDDYPATKCDYWTESAHGAGWPWWYTCQWPAWLDQHTRNNAYTGRWTLKQFFPSLSLSLFLSFLSLSLIRAQCSTAFYCICTGTRIHGTLRACDWRSLKSAARLPTVT